MNKRIVVLILALLGLGAPAFAQSRITLKLQSSEDATPVDYATVTLTVKGAKKATYAALSDANGAAVIKGVKSGTYTLKAELLGYKPARKEITVSANVDLGIITMKPDRQMLDAASVSAVGNPITIKRDTIEYNASSFKTSDNDVLEDLLKKLPGVEVSEDGSITVNGQTISKITIGGKTFFLDDPQLASKNIPAKAIDKLKVIDKKSEQAEFTGIDDGEEEHVIDLSIKKGMMNGLFGNVMGGGGHDLPTDNVLQGDWRYQGAAFVGNFTEDSQISGIANVNNTNNRGFNDLAGSMMQGMRGGGGGRGQGQGGWGSGNGITTSYMAGVNGAWTLLDGKMDIGGNYLYNNADKYVAEEAKKTTYMKDYNLMSQSVGIDANKSQGHRFGVRYEHKITDNTWLLFEPKVNFGSGYYNEIDTTQTFQNSYDPSAMLNSARTNNFGWNNNVSTSGFFLLRQRLGKPGRTLTAMLRYSFSNNDLSGENHNYTDIYESGQLTSSTPVDQWFNNNKQSTSLSGNVTYTEPLGGNFYLEANYGYTWDKSTSDKNTYSDAARTAIDNEYTNDIINNSSKHEFGVNGLYQLDKFRAQLGVAGHAVTTKNDTEVWDASMGKRDLKQYDPGTQWYVSPQAMLWGEFGKNSNARLFYRGTPSQPSTTQLMPVPDNSNPLSISFGNPSLKPYFSNELRGDYRYNNKKSFFSVNVRINANLVSDAITSMIWSSNGVQYSMPFNGPNKGDVALRCFVNAPIARSNFSIMNFIRASYSRQSSYVGTNIDMKTYEEQGYYKFMEWFQSQVSDPTYFAEHVTRNDTRTLGITERLKGTYRINALELSLQGLTRINHSWYTLASEGETTTTFNNQVEFSANWTWDAPGIGVKGDFDYNWYNGYTTVNKEPEYILNLEISKLLFKRKMTLALKGYDILGQAKNLTVTDSSNYHSETVNNTLGRYLILSLTYRFGTFDSNKMGPRHGGPGGPPPMR